MRSKNNVEVFIFYLFILPTRKSLNMNIVRGISPSISFVLSLSCVIALEYQLESNPSPIPIHHFRIRRQFNPGFSSNSQNFQRPQQNQNFNGFNVQRPPQNGQGQFPFQGSSNGQGQTLSNQFAGNQQQQQQQQQQQSWNNNLAGSLNSNQQGSTSSNNNNQAGSTNNNQPILWTSNQSDYQCVLNNCRGQSQWNPVCGTDNLVYDNVAVLRCAQQCGRRISFNYAGTCVVTTTAASK